LAIPGDKHDGHSFIDQVIAKGASLVIAKHSYKNQVSSHDSIIFVDDTLHTFSAIARAYLKTMPVKKVAITGSNGKTTTKEMLKAALGSIIKPDKIYANLGNRNNHFGVPLSALEVRPNHEIAIFEMGMNHEGEIDSLCSIIEPDIGAITNIGLAHVGNFSKGLDGVQKAKGELFQNIAQHDGKAIVNLDDFRICDEAKRASLKNIIGFGHHQQADVRIVSTENYTKNAQKIQLSIKGEPPIIDCHIPLLGAHQVNNAACALAIVHALDLPAGQAALGIKDMLKTSGRMNIFLSPKGYLVIDDGYNANPNSMQAGIQSSFDVEAKRRLAAIGPMGELGQISEREHIHLGKLLAAHFHFLFICGAKAEGRFVAEGAKAAGMPEKNILLTSSSIELIDPIKTMLKDGDLIFIKGSLTANMQAIAKALCA
jgi:UDP-N-acetylmuramoyl-tripeptide--D-alanyl-D-alanine ligase